MAPLVGAADRPLRPLCEPRFAIFARTTTTWGETSVSAEQNIATIKTLYEAFGRGDVDFILERCTDDVDWASGVASAVAPWQDPKHGKAELTSFFTGIAQS